MVTKILNIEDYVKIYNIAYEVMGADLLKKMTHDDEIIEEWVSNENWLMLPLPNEKSMNDAKNRLDPNIYITLNGEAGKEFVGIGLTCNTIESVQKMQNILDSYHIIEKNLLLSTLAELDDLFKTSVSSKIKENHFLQRPIYSEQFSIQTNTIDENSIKEMFRNVAEIRERGLKRMELEGKSHPIETPVIDLVYCEFASDEVVFRNKLQQVVQIFELSSNIKKSAEIKKDKKKLIDSKIVSVCRGCPRLIPDEECDGSRFCKKCGSLIKKIKNKDLNNIL
ncbi:MAG TPA: hypothetical protein VFC41_08760 [Anaerovoracaceae bacterium]|nr:hypothetical protein [Anaerovoracaceae bacterium]